MKILDKLTFGLENKNEIIIRDNKKDDANKLVDLMLKNLDYHCEINEGFKKYVSKNKKSMHNDIITTSKSGKFIIAEVDGNIAGFLLWKEIKSDNEMFNNKISISELYVDNDYRGRSIGRSLIEKLIERNDKNIILRVLTVNKNAFKLYKDIGFKIIDTVNRSNIESYIMEYEKI